MGYTFPFSTCEIPSAEGSLVAQPASMSINLFSTVALLAAAAYAQTTPLRVTLASYALFEAWHTWSHIQHQPGNTQKHVVHALGYAMAFSTLWMIQAFSRTTLPPAFLMALGALCIADIVAQWVTSDIPMIFTGLSIFAWIVLGRWSVFPKSVKRAVPWLIGGLVLLLGLFINEAQNCQKMQTAHPFPYHAVIEVLGAVLFISLALVWLEWERQETF